VSPEENKAVVRKAIEEVNNRDPAKGVETIIDGFTAPDYIDHTNQLRGPEGVKQFYAVFLKAFPDYHRTIEDIIAEGDKVWVHSITTMTHTGKFHGAAPTGKKITITGVNIYRMVNGKVVEGWNVTDQLDMLKQLGVIEYTEKGKKLFPEDGT